MSFRKRLPYIALGAFVVVIFTIVHFSVQQQVSRSASQAKVGNPVLEMLGAGDIVVLEDSSKGLVLGKHPARNQVMISWEMGMSPSNISPREIVRVISRDSLQVWQGAILEMKRIK